MRSKITSTLVVLLLRLLTERLEVHITAVYIRKIIMVKYARTITVQGSLETVTRTRTNTITVTGYILVLQALSPIPSPQLRLTRSTNLLPYYLVSAPL